MTAEWTDWEEAESQNRLAKLLEIVDETDPEKLRDESNPHHVAYEALEYAEASPYAAWQRYRHREEDPAKFEMPGGIKFCPAVEWGPDVRSAADFPKLADDDVILGVIDSGIPLGHSRLRDKQGKSRVLTAWQMNAPSGVGERVPLGRELTNGKINDLLRKHSNGKLTDPLDEDAFNREAGLVDFSRRFGHRELGASTSHGAAVIDIAAGCDPHAKDETFRESKRFAEKTKIIAVNLPNHTAIGYSGEFLDMYILLGVKRILDTARALWTRNNGNAPGAYPVVINISYGRQAGEKLRGKDRFNVALTRMVETYREITEDPEARCGIVMPSGNDNLDRVHAELCVPPRSCHELALQVQPGDQSSSYVEVWTYANSKEQLAEIDFAVEPPSVGRRKDFKLREPDPGNSEKTFQRSLGDFARIYTITRPTMDTWTNDGQPDDRYIAGFLICIAPTDSPEGRTDLAPAGPWRIVVQNNSQADFEVMAMVQTEQSTLVASEINRRAYFDDPDYVRYDETTGTIADNFRIVKALKGLARIDAGFGVIRRGSMNSTAANTVCACIAGFRLSDGVPAPYSSSGIGRKVKHGRGAPSISLPTDYGTAHPGVMTSGAADGSVAFVQGTSFASALAARLIAEKLITGQNPSSGKNLLQRDYHQSITYTAFPHTSNGQNIIEKVGNKRLPELPRGRIERYPDK